LKRAGPVTALPFLEPARLEYLSIDKDPSIHQQSNIEKGVEENEDGLAP